MPPLSRHQREYRVIADIGRLLCAAVASQGRKIPGEPWGYARSDRNELGKAAYRFRVQWTGTV
jgi:hypothetical protein